MTTPETMAELEERRRQLQAAYAEAALEREHRMALYKAAALRSPQVPGELLRLADAYHAAYRAAEAAYRARLARDREIQAQTEKGAIA